MSKNEILFCLELYGKDNNGVHYCGKTSLDDNLGMSVDQLCKKYDATKIMLCVDEGKDESSQAYLGRNLPIGGTSKGDEIQHLETSLANSLIRNYDMYGTNDRGSEKKEAAMIFLKSYSEKYKQVSEVLSSKVVSNVSNKGTR